MRAGAAGTGAAGEESGDTQPVLPQLTTELSAALSHFEAGLQILTSSSPIDEWKQSFESNQWCHKLLQGIVQ